MYSQVYVHNETSWYRFEPVAWLAFCEKAAVEKADFAEAVEAGHATKVRQPRCVTGKPPYMSSVDENYRVVTTMGWWEGSYGLEHYLVQLDFIRAGAQDKLKKPESRRRRR